MALKKQTLSIPFARGLDQKTSEATGEPGSLSSAKNVTMEKAGLISKRKGFDTFRDSSTIVGDTTPKGKTLSLSTGANVYSYDEDLLVADGSRLYHKSGASDLQDAGALLNCTFSRNQIYSDESKKIGQVRSVRVTRSGNDYDVMAWVQTDPIKLSDYEICIAVRDVSSGAFYRKPYILDSTTRTGNTSQDRLWMTAPSVHLEKISDDKIFIIYRTGDATTITSQIKYALIPDFIASTFSSSISRVDVTPSFSRIPSNTATSIATCLSSDSSDPYLYIAFYSQPGSAGSLGLVAAPYIARFEIASTALTFSSEVEVFKAVSPNASFNTHSHENYFYGNGYIPGIALHHAGGANLLICFNADGHHTSSRLRISTWCAVVNESLSQSSNAFQHSNLQNKVMANAGFLNFLGTTGFITAVQGNSNSLSKSLGVENNNFASSEYVDSSTIPYRGLRVKTYFYNVALSSAASPTTGQQYVKYYSVKATGTSPALDTPSGMAWIRWENITDSSGNHSANIFFSVIEPGAGFKTDIATGLIVSGEQSQIEAWIKDQIGSWFVFPSGTVTLESDSQNDFTRAPFHEILHLNFNSSLNGFDDVTPIHQNATVVSEPVFTANAGAIVIASRTNDNVGDSNTFEFITDSDGVIHGTSITGNSSYNVTSEYSSMTRTCIRLFDSVSKIDSFSNRLEYSTNTLIKTFLSSSANPLETYIKYLEQIFAPVRCVIDLSPERTLPGINGGNCFLIGAGTLFCYDGEELIENGYYESPSIRSINAVSTAVDSRLTAGEFYSYSVVYEHVDASGNLHESPPLAPVEVQTSANFKSVALRIPTFDATRKIANRISIYRTRENGPVLKKIVSLEPSASQLALGHIDYVDLGESEEDFNNLPILYTTGGLLANNQPGSVTDLCEHKGRVVAATPTEYVIFSKVNAPGFSYSFPLPSFVIDLPVDSNLITAVESNPNFLTIFTADDVFVVSGDGPNNLGVGSFTRPNLLAGGQGAIKGSPHASTVFGTFYISERGIYLVAPNGQIQYLGASVEDLISGKTINSIDYFDSTNEIRFLCSTGDANSNFLIVCYNTVFQQWYSWEVNKDSGQTAVGQCLYSPTGLTSDKYHHILLSDGELLRQGTGYTDRAAAVQYNMDFEIKNISAAGLQGAQRIYRLMALYDYHSAASLNITITNDYKATGSASTSEQHAITLAADFEQALAHLRNQKSTAIRARFVVTAAAQGISMNGLALQVGVRPTAFKKPSAQIAQES